MNRIAALSHLLDDRSLHTIEPGLFSVLSPGALEQRYDHRARAYDYIVGSELYNRLCWGASPKQYRAFAREAVCSASSGWLLDAGCGTMMHTAEAYLEAPHRPVVGIDRSLGMLRRARERLLDLAGTPPEHIVLLQADLFDLPFRTGAFRTILCMGMLHLFEEVTAVVDALQARLDTEGQLFLTSLVENERWGDYYLRLLYRAGEVASPRTPKALEAVLRQTLPHPPAIALTGNMAYAVTPAPA